MENNALPTIPAIFERRLYHYLGEEEATQLLASLGGAAPVSIRFHPDKAAEPTAVATHLPLQSPVVWEPAAYYLHQRPAFALDPHWHAGAYYVQEASSMFVGEAVRQLALPSQARVLDLCAAPGGKTTHLLSVLPADALLVANEIHKTRAQVLLDNLARWGKPNYWVSNNSPETLGEALPAGMFDLMLTDVPCSGEGMFRKDATAIEEWSEENVTHCSTRQKDIAQAVAHLLAPGGYWLYSTCTYAPEENEAVIADLVEQYGLLSHRLSLPQGSGIVEKVHQMGGKTVYTYHFYPHKIVGEGLFLACLHNDSFANRPTIKANKKQAQQLATASAKERALLSPWLKAQAPLGDDWTFIKQPQGFYALPQAQAQLWAALQDKGIYWRNAGVFMGELKQQQLVPAHALALSTALNVNVPQLELSYEEALSYLRRDHFELQAEAPNGWVLACYEGTALGWLKVLQKRVNNYYPAAWRLRS
ncbi:methyltransferase RsmF C-terminal domain-like protein [Eisenibacter elegans]|uniref:methyltransferase RsmF C-terminal domain-like protein n=1 Tax=Eisenibacter elegans TaxID=997 RepID=UPI00040C2183|nr:hypothetical protein [Eisenibacter elegans]